jgi:chromosome segregation ATPase
MEFDNNTPRTTLGGRNQAAKRLRSALSSDSSDHNEGDLSYLDLDSGKVLQASQKTSESKVTLTLSEYDALMSKLMLLEKGLDKLNKLDKLDKIEKSVQSMNNKIIDFEQRLKHTENSSKEFEKSVNFVSSQFDDMVVQRNTDVVKLNELELSVKTITRENDEIRAAMIEMKAVNSSLKEELLDVKCRAMRDNLVFTNIDYTEGEDCENVLRSFIRDKLEIREEIQFERVHRSRPHSSKYVRFDKGGKPIPRPIIAKFSFF